MSDNSRNLIWHYYAESLGAPMILAIALADASNDFGAGISEKIEDLAAKTRQSRRAVQLQLRRLELSGFLSRETSGGGRGILASYKLNLVMLVTEKTDAAAQEKGERGSPFTGQKGRTAFALLGAETANGVRPFESYSIRSTKELRQGSVETRADDVATFTLSEDTKLAQWMFGKLQALNPKLRTPSWSAWVRDIRLMRERDGRNLREIAELFAFANADEFWQANIESPGTLRKQWNKLSLKRSRAGGSAPAPGPADTRCAGVKPSGDRCGAVNTTSDSTDGRGPFFCWDCRRWQEQKRAAGRSAAGVKS